MTGNFFLDWAIMAASLANVILLLWLGLTVLLNAERRSWDVWLAGSGLLLGGAFFSSHTAILGYSPRFLNQGLNVWWYAGWIPVVMLPFAWYVMMLWYAGYWLRLGRQRGWLLLTSGLLASLLALLIFASPLPSLTQIIQLQFSTTLAAGGAPLILVIYPLYVLLCIGLALQVLRAPAPSPRLMGDQARRRARPWLMAASMVLLLVSLLVAGVVLWLLTSARGSLTLARYTHMGLIVGWLDLIIATLIGLAVVLLGQAIVAYAVFTGKNLPRQEFQRQWRNTLILAVGYGAVIGWSLSLRALPVYTLLLTTLLMTLFYALLIWRSYTWRERYIRHLRPFVTSQHLYEHLITPVAAPPPTVDVATPFRALCQEVLGTQRAYLLAVGPLAPLVDPLVYPEIGSNKPVPSSLQQIVAAFHSPQTMCLPLDPVETGGALWAVPLWSERGLIGLFLLGAKQDGGLYTQEEIEIARASGERLIDTRASAEIARRLMTLQHRRLTESQVLDRRARRLLHDDILPQLHTALLMLSAGVAPANGNTAEAVVLLSNTHQQISNLLREMPAATPPILGRLGLIKALQALVADEFNDAFDGVAWQIEPGAETLLQTLPPLTAEVIFYATREVIRNAARHGRGDDPQRPLHLAVIIAADHGLTIQIEDNGVGLETSGPLHNGSGQGLALHSAMLAVVGGVLDVESVPDCQTRVTVGLPQEALG